MKRVGIFLASILLVTLFVPYLIIPRVSSEDTGTKGPRLDGLTIKYYSSQADAYAALKNGDVDLIDAPLSPLQIDEVYAGGTGINLASSPASNVYEFDFNNNATTPTYPNWANPTSYKKFRQGIACLVNKDQILQDFCNQSYRVDTPIARPNDDWWVDPSVSEYDSHGATLDNYPYEYSSSLAASYFNAGGFVQGSTPNPYYSPGYPGSAQYLRVYPAGHPKHGQDLDPLIFYIRNDDPARLQAGRSLRDNLRMMGVPVNAYEQSYAQCLIAVCANKDFHIYTGGYSLYYESWIEPDSTFPYYLNLYTTQFLDSTTNYVHFSNSTYDAFAHELEYPKSLAEARNAALACQKILVQEAVASWLYSNSFISGYKNLYGASNSRGARIDNRWTFLKAANTTARSNLNYGLTSPPSSLNVFTDSWTSRTMDCLECIYDTLISYCPYDRTPGDVNVADNPGRAMPWMATDWRVEPWQSPYNVSETLTKLTFYLRDNINWHDGIRFNSSDVEFTIDYLRGLGSDCSLQWAVQDVDHVATPDANTVVVYENVSSVRTLDLIGKLPMLPKHVFWNITDITGYVPGADQGYNANQTLIGTGPWKYVSDNSSTLVLEANRDYFMSTPPVTESDFRYNWERGSWVVDALDSAMTGEAFGTSATMPIASLNKYEPGCQSHSGSMINILDVAGHASKLGTTWGSGAVKHIPTGPTDCLMYVEPVSDPKVTGDNVTVHINLLNVDWLSGVQFELDYDNERLNWTSTYVNQIFGTTPLLVTQANQSLGYVRVYLTLIAPTSPVGGSVDLATVTFNAMNVGFSPLSLTNTLLAKCGGSGFSTQPLPHNIQNQGLVVGVETPAGENVTVSPASNANVTFAETTSSGVTTLNVIQAPSQEFQNVLCSEIKTTASYSGNILLRFNYNDTGLSLEDEQSMKIWVWNETSTAWVDVTTSVDTDNNIVYGTSPHLSIFGVTCNIALEGSVSTGGQTTIGTPAIVPPCLGADRYWEIKSTAVYSGSITLRMTYDDAGLTPQEEASIRLWVWDEPSRAWADITTSLDTTNNVVRGVTPHLSIFGVTSYIQLPSTISVSSIFCPKTVACVGYPANLQVSFVAKNNGLIDETFDFNVRLDSQIVATIHVSHLGPGSQTALSFTCSTAGLAIGEHAIGITPQTLTWIRVASNGDLNADGIVDIFDIARVAIVFGTTYPNVHWDFNADINNDGVMDIFDIAIVAIHFGQTG
ncbi:MAG TPA: ABC transporter substrate-binding protein [Candidatus Eisenbacteria bacterium]|nr:ABC transporter substrate-binding protein [Candidatus Eisenbacteria bacterium]